MHARLVRAGALAIALAIPMVASACRPLPTPLPGSQPAPAHAGAHTCDRTAYVVGDSRRTFEHTVLPRTTDLVWAKQLGTVGGETVDGMRHVRYLAEPGVVHERFQADLAALMAMCSPGERPLVFDFMGTNYAIQQPERIDDPAFYREIRKTIAHFYATAAPNARVVLAELTLDRTTGDATVDAGIDRLLDRYNEVLRSLARTLPARFFFLPAPAIYEHDVVWRDTAHESAELPLAAYLAGDDSGDLDAAGVALIEAADGNPCALLDDDRFGIERYSEGATLGAYLTDFRRSPEAQRWLARRSIFASARLDLAKDPVACTA